MKKYRSPAFLFAAVAVLSWASLAAAEDSSDATSWHKSLQGTSAIGHINFGQTGGSIPRQTTPRSTPVAPAPTPVCGSHCDGTVHVGPAPVAPAPTPVCGSHCDGTVHVGPAPVRPSPVGPAPIVPRVPRVPIGGPVGPAPVVPRLPILPKKPVGGPVPVNPVRLPVQASSMGQ